MIRQEKIIEELHQSYLTKHDHDHVKTLNKLQELNKVGYSNLAYYSPSYLYTCIAFKLKQYITVKSIYKEHIWV